jgi:hypothetical protein
MRDRHFISKQTSQMLDDQKNKTSKHDIYISHTQKQVQNNDYQLPLCIKSDVHNQYV